MNEKIKIIYISGIGRSGSTLLDAIISTSPKVFSVGEIYKYNSMKKQNIFCSCGRKFNACNFWKHFTKDKTKIANRMNFKDYIRMINFLFLDFKKKINFNSASENYKLYSKIKEICPKKIEYILDSSKDLLRLIEIDKDARFEVYNISVVRDGRAVANSFNSKTQSNGKNYIISLLKWIFINKCLIRYLNIRKGKSILISYDLFCKNPEKYIKKIENFLNIKIPKNYISVIRNMEYHNLGGNRISSVESRKNIKDIKHDEKWRTDQNTFNKLIGKLLTYNLNRKIVYYEK